MKFKFYRWAAKNKLLCRLVFNLLLCSVYSVLLALLECPAWVIVLLNCLLIFLTYLFPDSAQGYLMNAAAARLQNDCDPEPLYLETLEQLRCKNSGANQQVIRINHCAALREMGQFQQARDLLKSINIDRYSGTLPVTKAIYYNNLSDICDLLGDPVQSTIWYGKLMQIYSDMPEGRFKKSLSYGIQSATVSDHIRKGTYDQAMAILNTMPRDNRKQAVDHALLFGQVCLKMGDPAAAKAPLEYAAVNGGKTCAAQIARQLLTQYGE